MMLIRMKYLVCCQPVAQTSRSDEYLPTMYGLSYKLAESHLARYSGKAVQEIVCGAAKMPDFHKPALGQASWIMTTEQKLLSHRMHGACTLISKCGSQPVLLPVAVSDAALVLCGDLGSPQACS